jgi:hypothetical protein
MMVFLQHREPVGDAFPYRLGKQSSDKGGTADLTKCGIPFKVNGDKS